MSMAAKHANATVAALAASSNTTVGPVNMQQAGEMTEQSKTNRGGNGSETCNHATAATLPASSNTTDSTLVDDNEGLLEDEEVDKGAPSRAADLASELGKALGVISNVPKVTAGKSLMQVRMSAVAATCT
eukprot:gene1625-33015_t